MTEGFAISSFDLALLIGRGLFILLLLRLLAYLVDLSPLRNRYKELLRAIGPPFAVLVCVVYLLSAVQQIFGAYAAAMPLMVGVLLVGCTVALWGPIRDMLAGAFLRAGSVLRVGDEVQIGDVRGRIDRLGYRRLVLRTSEGEAIVPYSLVQRSAIVVGKSTRTAATHTFRVRPIAGVSLVELRQLIRQSALLCHWTAPARDPELANAEQGAIDVTVFAVSADYAPEIENAVRKRLSAIEQARASEGLSAVMPMPTGRDGGDEAGGGAGRV